MPSKTRDDYITVTEVANLLGCNVQSVRAGLINGTFPVGIAWYSGTKEKNGQWNFRIPREPFIEFLKGGKLKDENM